jgi:serine/threonine protein kinase
MLGIVHCDIKPQNMLLCPSDPTQIKLIDFGIARRYIKQLPHPAIAIWKPGKYIS